MTDHASIVIVEDGEKEHVYKRIDSQGYWYEKDESLIASRDFVGYISRINSDESLKIVSIEEYVVEEDKENQVNDHSFLNQIIEEIKNRTAVAASDAVMVGEYIVAH